MQTQLNSDQIKCVRCRQSRKEMANKKTRTVAIATLYLSCTQVTCRTQNFQDLKKSACGRDPKTNKARGGPKKLSTDISALFSLQDPREAYLRPR